MLRHFQKLESAGDTPRQDSALAVRPQLLARPRKVEEHQQHVVFCSELCESLETLLEARTCPREVARFDCDEPLEEGCAGDAGVIDAAIQVESLVGVAERSLVILDIDGQRGGADERSCLSCRSAVVG